MTKNTISHHQQDLLALLAGVSGHFEVTSPQDERSIQSLQETLARVLPGEDITTIKTSFFSVENSDLFFTDTIAPHQLTRLQELVGRGLKEAGSADLRVFVREVPVRSTQMKGSVPLWAGGAALEKTIGPFHSKDGRKIWFDFFRIERLIALYIEGRPDPAILFNVSLLRRFIIHTLPPVIEPLTKYKLLPDSVWVNSEIFAPNAPAGFYTGLKIKHGEIALSAHPHIINSKLTISPNTIVTVKLELDQPAVTDADPASPYGIDARKATLELPKQLSFHFSGNGGAIDEIADNLQWSVYGHTAHFTWNRQFAPTYGPVLNRVLIPYTCSENSFAVNNCQSLFNTVSETASIQRSAWALPAAQVDVTKPPPAAGIGGIAIQCNKGLTAKWNGLQGGEVNLSNPYVLCDAGRISITDLQAGNLCCNQEYALWKDDLNPFASSVKLQYTNAFPFLYNALANGTETLLAFANTNPLLDRPVTVSGQALDIHSKNSVLLDKEPRFPDLIALEYTVQATFKTKHAAQKDADLALPLELPITIPPAQIPKIASAGIALSPYVRNEKYSATELRRRFLWIEFEEPVKDPKDTYFARILAYAPDQLISNNHPELLIASEEPAFPVNPEYIRVITPNQSNDNAGLDAMQPMEKATDSDRHYLLPLPPGLHSESPEMFGFFTYEFRVGHYRYNDTTAHHKKDENVWSTAQGRFGRVLRATGIQHPAPTLTCTVNRDEEKLYVSAPYAVAVHKGKNITSDPPRTELWCLLYAQVKQADNQDFLNILLDDKMLDWNVRVEHDKRVDWAAVYTDEQRMTLKRVAIRNWKDELDYGNFRHVYQLADIATVNKDATKYGTVIWSNNEINQLLALYGLPPDSPLSVLCVEILPQITNLYDHVNSLDSEEVQRNLKSTVTSENFPSEGIIKEEMAIRKKAMQSVNLSESKPLSNNLGHYRILRTSPLTEVPFVCCTECKQQN